jgi:hypothetical protein
MQENRYLGLRCGGGIGIGTGGMGVGGGGTNKNKKKINKHAEKCSHFQEK